MQQELNKNKRLAYTFWTLSAICFVVIFYFSSRTADESAMQSASILDLIIRILGDNAVTDFIVRKSAHFLEYVGTCLLLNFAWLFTKGKKQELLAIGCASLYAITDEVHQIFVDGRSCELRDWGIDTLGAIVGTIIFLIIYKMINKMLKKNNSN